ncbi:hypothetical protein [Paraburkholderia sp. C35]|uniref:carbapenem self-resistance protein CarG family protein n=1 Tax=Paraburkholderia sp. C35 TaxID=2126993 RepID=UPI0013A588AF|nr:hypothetical protein [Paraburkholderia sp. C35]
MANIANAQDATTVFSITNGINRLRLHGSEAMIVRASRENFNAHGFDVVSIFVRNDIGPGSGTWSIVPMFHSDAGVDHEDLHLLVGGGADCQLHDFRLLTSSNANSAQLILADREPGTSYADAANVHFNYYVLSENSAESPGHPMLYFNWYKSQSARAQYCDVNRAFDQELHLGTTSSNP